MGIHRNPPYVDKIGSGDINPNARQSWADKLFIGELSDEDLANMLNPGQKRKDKIARRKKYD